MKKPNNQRKHKLYLVKNEPASATAKKEVVKRAEAINTFEVEIILTFLLQRKDRLSESQKHWFETICSYLSENGCLTQPQQNMLFSFYTSLGGFKIQLTMSGFPLLKLDNE